MRLSRLSLRAALALARPFLAAPDDVPRLHVRRCLHVFARTPGTDHADVEVAGGASVAALKDAVIAKLRLAAPPHLVRLLLEADGAGQLPVPLDSCRALALQGVAEGCRVVAEAVVAAAPPPPPHSAPAAAPAVTLELRLRTPRGTPGRALTQPFASSLDFDRLMAGRTLYHMRAAKGGDRAVKIIADVGAAVAVRNAAATGDYLSLDDPSTSDVSTLKGFSENLAGGFEQLSNRALALNPDLLAVYGGKLEALNGGRGVTFYDAAGDAYVQCDGLVRGAQAVLLNEAKAHFHEEDVRKLKDATAVKLRHIQAQPELYSSDAEGVIEQLQGLRVVLVASSSSFSREAELACARAGIHQLHQDGSGFACVLGGCQ